MMKTPLLMLFSGVLIIGSAFIAAAIQGPAGTPAALNAEAIKAYQAKDYARFLALERRALELAPTNPRVIYNVACGEALQNNPGEAVRLLDQLLVRKLDLGAETDDDFAGLHNTKEWTGFQSRLAGLRKPIIRSEAAFTLAEPGLLATGIATAPRTGDVFIAGAWLAIDPNRGLLFASCAAVPFMSGYRKEDAGQSGLFVWDLKSGR